MPVTVTLSLEHRLLGLEPLIMNLEPAKAKEQAGRFSVLEKIEVPRNERKRYFNLSAPVNQQFMPDWEAMANAPKLSLNFEKAEIRALLSMIDDVEIPVDQMRWMIPLRAKILEYQEGKSQSIAFSIETRLGLEAVVNKLEPKKPADQETSYDVYAKISLPRKEKDIYFKEITPSAINWGAIEEAPDLVVEFTKQDVQTLLDDVLKNHKVSVKDLEWLLALKTQIEQQLKHEEVVA